MDTTLTIQGMHCDACKNLIRMEIDDIGLSSKIRDIDLTSENNMGFVALKNIDNESIQKIKESINGLGNYQVIN